MNDKHKKRRNECRRCGRELFDIESIKKGIGPVCLQKEQQENPKIRVYGLWDHVYAREIKSREDEFKKGVMSLMR